LISRDDPKHSEYFLYWEGEPSDLDLEDEDLALEEEED